MAWYATIARPPAPYREAAALLAAGPFHTHGQAMALLPAVRAAAAELAPAEAPWLTYGTARHRTSHPPADHRFAAKLAHVHPPRGLP